MTPQSTFMVRRTDRRRAGGEPARAAGHHDRRRRRSPIPHNAVGPVRPASTGCTSPASSSSTAHTTDDIAVYGVTPPPWPPVARLPGRLRRRRPTTFLDELVERGRPGPAADLRALRGLRARQRPASPGWPRTRRRRRRATSTGSAGRVRQIREEATLRAAPGRRVRRAMDEPPPRADRASCADRCWSS